MKIEFLPDGSPDCPLIRLFDFTLDEAKRLQQSVLGLIATDSPIVVDKLSFVKSVDGCCLTLEVGRRDQGIMRAPENRNFVCRMTRDAWDDVAALIEPFADEACGFQWLIDNQGDVNLLLSATGDW